MKIDFQPDKAKNATYNATYDVTYDATYDATQVNDVASRLLSRGVDCDV